MADVYGDQVQVLLVNVEEHEQSAYDFAIEAGLRDLPVLLDSDGAMYDSYTVSGQGAYAPFPQQAIVDQDGVITYFARQHDVAAVRAELDRLLAE